MAEGRMLKKRLSKSSKLAALNNDSARFLYCIIYPHLDIKGRHEADPIVIKGQIVPYIKSWTLKKIQICLQQLHNIGLIILYKIDGIQYLEYTRFEYFQRLDPKREAKSEIPMPTPEQLQSKSRTTPAEVKVKLNISKDKSSDPNYIIYGDFVALTQEEYQKLIEAYGKSIIHQYIDRLNNYIGSKGRKYKSHYHTILVWLNKDNIKKQPKKEPSKGKPDPVQREKVAKLIQETTGNMK